MPIFAEVDETNNFRKDSIDVMAAFPELSTTDNSRTDSLVVSSPMNLFVEDVTSNNAQTASLVVSPPVTVIPEVDLSDNSRTDSLVVGASTVLFREVVTSNNSRTDSLVVGTGTTTGRGPLIKGKLYWGAAGHRDQGGVYSGSISQQIADLKNIFGSTANSIVYRGIGQGQSPSACQTDALALKAANIYPIVQILTKPAFSSFASDAAAYTWGFDNASSYITGTPAVPLYEIGNEWNLKGINAVGDPLLLSSWRNGSLYSKALNVAAGAVAAIRAKRSDAAVIAGATAGWTAHTLALALCVDLAARGLKPDYANLHWYNDANGRNQMGDPRAKFGNVYVRYVQTGIPIALTEGGSNGGATADGNNIAGLMASFAQTLSSSAEADVQLFNIYQLYPNGGEGYQLFSSPGTIAASGQVVKNYVSAHPF